MGWCMSFRNGYEWLWARKIYGTVHFGIENMAGGYVDRYTYMYVCIPGIDSRERRKE